MKLVIFLLAIFLQLLSLGGEWIQPPKYSNKGYLVPSPDYTPLFPKDHGAHRAYGLEWWYWIGHLHTMEGEKKFGFQSTVFVWLVILVIQMIPISNALEIVNSTWLTLL